MSTYPNEQYPPNDAILALNGATDIPTGLDYIARGVHAHSEPSYEVQYNRRLLRQNGILAALRQGMVVAEDALFIGVYPIRYSLGGVRKTFDGATGVAIPDDATRRLYLDAAGQLQASAAYPADASTYLPLATVVAASGAMTIQDDRCLALFSA